MTHTPAPWIFTRGKPDDGNFRLLPNNLYYEITCGEGNQIQSNEDYYDICMDADDAEHAVKCVNLHDELLEALENMVKSHPRNDGFYRAAKALIAKAKGKS